MRDYDLRHQGTYNVIERPELVGAVEALERGRPTLADGRLVMLVAYLHFRNSNEWFLDGDRPISIARFLRTAFLTSILKDTEISPLDTANAIDRATQAAMGY